MRYARAIIEENLPLVYWYKQVDLDYDWSNDVHVSATGPTSDDSETSDRMPFWTRFSHIDVSSLSAVAAGMATAFLRKRKALILPVLVGCLSPYAMWTMDKKAG